MAVTLGQTLRLALREDLVLTRAPCWTGWVSYLPQVRSWVWLSNKVTESRVLLLACVLLLVKTRRFPGPTLPLVPRKSCHALLPGVCQA